jgi:hypothetical protein
MLRRILVVLLFGFLFASPALAGNIVVTVDIQMQTMHVRVDGVTRYRWDVSTGRAGYDTPPGRYQPIRMHKKYFSRKYDNAPMPFAIFFHGGYAIHGTTDLKRLGRVASHGCVRLHPDNASALFELVKEMGSENTVIRVQSTRAAAAIVSDPIVPEGEVVESADVAPEDLDALTTGSTGAISVKWLRKGLDG